MKILAILIILETLFSALPAFAGHCADDPSEVNSLVVQQGDSSKSNPVNERHDHEGNLNHRCHLGHCAFVMQETSVKLKPKYVPVESFAMDRKLYVSFISKPFRPPIASIL